ncbi:hypothetical protein QOT17_011570 [Balamuthia mandrillaris]
MMQQQTPKRARHERESEAEGEGEEASRFSDPHYVVRVNGVPFRVPLKAEARVQAYQRQQRLAQKRRDGEQRLLAALKALLPKGPVRSDRPSWRTCQISAKIDLGKLAYEADVEELLQFLAEKPKELAVEQLRDADDNDVTSLVALYGSVRALRLLPFNYSNVGKAFEFAKLAGHQDCLQYIGERVQSERLTWYLREQDLEEVTKTKTSRGPVPKLRKACAAVLAHELSVDVANNTSSPSSFWSAVVKSASDEALEHILSSVCNHLPLPRRGAVLMHLFAHHNNQQLASFLSSEAKVEVLLACDKYWRDLSFAANRRSFGLNFSPDQHTPGDVFSIFETPAEMWRIEPEDAFERQHKIFRDANAIIKMKAAEDEKTGQRTASVVTCRETFRKKMEVFSQGQLKGLNWDNLLVLGGAVVACLLSSPFDEADPAHLNQYFVDTFGEGSDIDLCIYGIEDSTAIVNKVVEIYTTIVKAIPDVPVTTISTRESITFLRHHPYRPIQVMGAFHSVAEVLHGIDLDCTCVSFDGKDVWALPRAWMAFNHRWNLTHGTRAIYGVRGCPHYEQRLVKYAKKRGFAVVDRDLVRDEEGNILQPASSKTRNVEVLLAEPDYATKFSWMYSGDDLGEDCYPAVGLKLLLLCERYPRVATTLLSLKPTDSIPYGKDWPAEKVIEHLKVHARSRWEEPSKEDEWKAEFNHFDGYTRWHAPPELIHHTGKLPLSGDDTGKETTQEVQAEEQVDVIRRSAKELRLVANHQPFLVPHWLLGILDASDLPKTRDDEEEDDEDEDEGNEEN